MKAVFENLEAEVDQNKIDLKSGEIERKNLLITNENLSVECLSKDVFYTVTDYVLNVSRFPDMHDAFTIAQKRIADLESENFNLRNKIQNDDHDSMIKHFSELEVKHFNLQLNYQNLKECFGNKKPVISSDAPSFDSLFMIEKLNEQIQNPIFDLKALVSQNKDLTAKLNTLHDFNERFRAENAKVKKHYKELYDSIKIARAKTTDQNNSLLSEIKNLKGQLKDNSKCVTIPDSKPKVLAPGRYPIDVEPIPPRHKNNWEVHLHYIKHLKESVETLREIIEDAEVERPLDTFLASACRYTKHSQELLEYVIGVKGASEVAGKCLLELGHCVIKSECYASLIYQKLLAPVDNRISGNMTQAAQNNMIGDRFTRLRNSKKKFIGTIRFEMNHFGAFMVRGLICPLGDSVISRFRSGLIMGTEFVNKPYLLQMKRCALPTKKTVLITPAAEGRCLNKESALLLQRAVTNAEILQGLPLYDEYFETPWLIGGTSPSSCAQALVQNPNDPSVSIPIDQEAPSGSHSLSSLDHQYSSVHQGVAAEHSFEVNHFVVADPEPFV
ncbi:hypothetical protein Tco_0928359 [Tanacetum coccineum]